MIDLVSWLLRLVCARVPMKFHTSMRRWSLYLCLGDDAIADWEYMHIALMWWREKRKVLELSDAHSVSMKKNDWIAMIVNSSMLNNLIISWVYFCSPLIILIHDETTNFEALWWKEKEEDNKEQKSFASGHRVH